MPSLLDFLNSGQGGGLLGSIRNPFSQSAINLNDYIGGTPQQHIDQSFGVLPPTPQQRIDQGFGATNAQPLGMPPQAPPPMPPPQDVSNGQPPQGAMPVSMPTGGGEQAPAAAVQPSMMGGLNNYIDNNRAMLLALAGGLAHGGIGEGFGQAANAQVQSGAKWGVIGKDMFGNEQYGWINQHTQQITPAGGSATGGAAGGAAGGADAILAKIAAHHAAGTPEKAINEVPLGFQSYVKDLLAGRALPTNLGRPGPARAAIITYAHAVEPGFDETQIPMRVQFAKDMGSSSPNSYGGQVRASGTVVKHLGDAYDTLDTIDKGALGPTDTLNVLNPLKTAIRGQTGDQAFQDAKGRWDIAKKGIAGELEKLLSGSHGAEASKQYWMDKLDFDKGPTAIKAALDEVRSLMMGRLENVALQKERAYGTRTDPLSLLGDKERKIAEKIRSGSYAGSQQQQTSGGTQPAAPAATAS